MRTSNSDFVTWVYQYLIHRAAGMDFDASGNLFQRDRGHRIPGINAPVTR